MKKLLLSAFFLLAVFGLHNFLHPQARAAEEFTYKFAKSYPHKGVNIRVFMYPGPRPSTFEISQNNNKLGVLVDDGGAGKADRFFQKDKEYGYVLKQTFGGRSGNKVIETGEDATALGRVKANDKGELFLLFDNLGEKANIGQWNLSIGFQPSGGYCGDIITNLITCSNNLLEGGLILSHDFEIRPPEERYPQICLDSPVQKDTPFTVYIKNTSIGIKYNVWVNNRPGETITLLGVASGGEVSGTLNGVTDNNLVCMHLGDSGGADCKKAYSVALTVSSDPPSITKPKKTCSEESLGKTPGVSGPQYGPQGKFDPYCPGGKDISTAIGCIPIQNTNEFVAWILRWAIGIAGGVAFLLMLFAGFQIMTASGNPERLQKGRELLTAAISGLILIIFSVFLLRLIGVEILNLPGFGLVSQ